MPGQKITQALPGLFRWPLIAFFTVMLLPLGHVSSAAGMDNITWTYLKEPAAKNYGTGPDIIRHAVSSDISVIIEPEATVFIDYEHGRLYRYRKSDSSCKSFPLNDSLPSPLQQGEGETLPLHKTASLLGSIKIIPTEEYRKIREYDCRKKLVLYASELAVSQLAISPAIEQFGRVFTEHMATCWVTKDFEGFDTLIAIARRHASIFEANPFLRQIDITGIMKALDGFPVRIEDTNRQGGEQYTLQSIGITAEENLFIIPGICRP